MTRYLALAIAFLGVAALSGCGGDDEPEGSGALAGELFSVGSKEFTEQLILGQMAIHLLEDAGATVQDNTGIVGTDNVRTALTSGDIDMYWEYTGTGWSSHLGREISEAPSDSQQLYEEVSATDAEENGIVWLDPAPMNNTYALVTSRSRSEELGITTISEYAELASSNASEATICGATEWLTRDDGLPGLEAAYGFELPSSAIAEVEFSLINTLVPDGDDCLFGEAFATDGSIPANDLVVLEDDQSYFVAYNVALTVRQDIYDEYGSVLADLFNPLTEVLTDEVMQTLNAKVDVDDEDPATVAEDFLKDRGFID